MPYMSRLLHTRINDLVSDQFKKRGVESSSTNSIAKDIEVGLQGSIAGLLVKGKLPDELKDPTMADKVISGMSQM